MRILPGQSANDRVDYIWKSGCRGCNSHRRPLGGCSSVSRAPDGESHAVSQPLVAELSCSSFDPIYSSSTGELFAPCQSGRPAFEAVSLGATPNGAVRKCLMCLHLS